MTVRSFCNRSLLCIRDLLAAEYGRASPRLRAAFCSAEIVLRQRRRTLRQAKSHADLQKSAKSLWPGYRQHSPSTLTVAEAIVYLHQAALLTRSLPFNKRYIQAQNDRFVHDLTKYLFSDASKLEQIRSLRPETSANLLWAMCQLGGSFKYTREVDFLVEVLDGQHLTADLVTFHILMLWQRPLHAATSPTKRVISIMQVVRVLAGLANAQHWTPKLAGFSRQAAATFDCLPLSQSSKVATLLWGFARLNYVPQQLLLKSQALKCFVEEVSRARLTLCLWSLAALGQTDHRLFTIVWQELSTRKDLGDEGLTKAHLAQLQQAALSAKFERGSTAEPLPQFPLLATATAMSTSALSTSSPPGSAYQKEISSCLTSLGISHVCEDKRWQMAVDIYIPDRLLAIEAEGPSHFTRNTHQPLGHTAFKHRLLRAMGCKVLSIDILEWDAYKGRADQAKFLLAAFERVR